MNLVPDVRISEITKEWCEILWKGKYGLVYPWGGKDAKSVQRLLAWMDKSIPDKEGAKNRLLEAMRNYLDEPSGFYADEKHPFGKFAAGSQKWMDLAPKRPTARRTDPHEELRPICNPEAVYEEFTTWALQDPEKAMRGFSHTHKLLRDKDLYERIKAYLLELLGKDRALKIYHEESKKSLTMPVT